MGELGHFSECDQYISIIEAIRYLRVDHSITIQRIHLTSIVCISYVSKVPITTQLYGVLFDVRTVLFRLLYKFLVHELLHILQTNILKIANKREGLRRTKKS